MHAKALQKRRIPDVMLIMAYSGSARVCIAVYLNEEGGPAGTHGVYMLFMHTLVNLVQISTPDRPQLVRPSSVRFNTRQ